MFEEERDTYDKEDTALYYTDRIQAAFSEKDPIATSAHSIYELAGNGDPDSFLTLTNEALKNGPVLAYELENGKKAFVLEKGGAAIIDSGDEALVPYLTHCVLCIADITHEGKNKKFVFHHSPWIDHIDEFINVLNQNAEVSSMRFYVNKNSDTYDRVEEIVKSISPDNQKKVGQVGIDYHARPSVNLIVAEESINILASQENNEGDMIYVQEKYASIR